MQKRRRFKQSTSLQDRLASFAKQASETASKLPPGPERDNLLRKARQAETASRYYDSFQRQIALENVEEDKAEASFKNGVLTISVPKSEDPSAGVKRIAINSQ